MQMSGQIGHGLRDLGTVLKSHNAFHPSVGTKWLKCLAVKFLLKICKDVFARFEISFMDLCVDKRKNLK